MRLKKSQKIILYFIIGAIAIFSIEKFIIAGLLNRLRGLNNKIKLAEGQLRKGMRIQKIKSKIVADYEFSKPYLETKSDNKKQIIAELLKEIESIVRISGGSIINLNPQEKGSQSNTYKADFRLELTFTQLLKFLDGVDKSKSLIELEKMMITSKDEEATAVRVDGVVSMTML